MQHCLPNGRATSAHLLAISVSKAFRTLLLASGLMIVFSMQAKAQDGGANDFKFLKTIDQVDIYFKQIFCDDNVEYLVVKVVNKSTSSVSLNLQPTFKREDTSFNSNAPVSFSLNEGETMIGACNTSNLRVSIFEFFSQFDSSSTTFDLTKI